MHLKKEEYFVLLRQNFLILRLPLSKKLTLSDSMPCLYADTLERFESADVGLAKLVGSQLLSTQLDTAGKHLGDSLLEPDCICTLFSVAISVWACLNSSHA